MVQASDAHNSVALDIDAGEFHCPLCKAVCNLMVPAIPDKEGELCKAVSVVAGGRVRRMLPKGSDEMDVSGDERQVGRCRCCVVIFWSMLVCDVLWLLPRCLFELSFMCW